MQITEVSVTGLRAALIDMVAADSALRFRLFPMVHIGMSKFYRQVAERLRVCGMVVAEGRNQPSSTGYSYLLATRITGRRGVGELVTQDIDYSALGVPVVWPERLENSARHRPGIGVWGWLDVMLLTPVLAASMLMGSRDWLLQRRWEISDNSEPRLRFGNKIFLRDTNADLLMTLDEIHRLHRCEDTVVAVVFGAAHMPAVVQGLSDRLGYQARSAEWLSVVDF